MRELFARYGRLLEEWPRIVEIARSLRAEGYQSTLNLSK